MVFVDVGITDEIGEPTRRVARQTTDQAQQRSAFGEVERRAQAQVVGADVEGQGNLPGLDIRVELIQQVARRQGHFIELGAVPAVEQDATAARVLDDGVDALANLVDGLVQHHVGLTVFLVFGNLAITLAQGLLDGSRVAERNLLVRRPFAPLHAVDFAEVVFALTERVGQPLGVFVGVLVPDLAAQGAEFGSVIYATQESAHFADSRFEGHFARGDRRETFLQVITQHRTRKTDGVHAGTVGLFGAVLDDVGDQFEILLHELPVSLNPQPSLRGSNFIRLPLESPGRGDTPARSGTARRRSSVRTAPGPWSASSRPDSPTGRPVRGRTRR
ncbi:hypothetical protein PS647_03548 [Pseudomonas fluorescens]|nr:hypothetical protein PS647_03548 [Pseudomonas fluorescens]